MGLKKGRVGLKRHRIWYCRAILPSLPHPYCSQSKEVASGRALNPQDIETPLAADEIRSPSDLVAQHSDLQSSANAALLVFDSNKR